MIKLIDILKGTIRDPFTGDIYEGLIKTIDIDQATNILIKKFNSLPGVDIVNNDREIKIGFEPQYASHDLSKYSSSSLIDPNISEVIKLANNLGYFPSVFAYEKNNKTKVEKYSNSKLREIMNDIEPDFLAFSLEKKYDEIIEVPKFVYHVTDRKYLDKIKSIGLTPKTKSKLASHPERIYVALNEDDVLTLWKKMSIFVPHKQGILLKIDTEGLDNVFYNDPNFKNKGAYTYNNIPSSNIVSIEPISEN